MIALGFIAWPYARFAYLLYFCGPSALERMAVTAPTYTLHYDAAPKKYAELRVPLGRGPFPIAMIIHGRCWDVTFGSSGTTAPVADTLTKRGIATLNLQDRVMLDPGGGWSGTMRDVGAAIDSVRVLAKSYPIDADRLVAVGYSAGAQLARWSAMCDRLSPGSDVALPDPLMPKAVVAIDGPEVLAEFVGKDAEICNKPVTVPFMGETPQQVPQHDSDASPQDHLPLRVHQYLAQAAFADLMQPYIDRARRSGDAVTTDRPGEDWPLHHHQSHPSPGQGAVAHIWSPVASIPR